MIPPPLHPTPPLRAVALEQFRTVGLAFRKVGVIVLAVLGVLGLVIILARLAHGAPGHSPPAAVEGGGDAVVVNWVWPRGTLEIICAGLFVPFGVWRSEDPARRAYHWTMPVARGPHTLLRVLAGWGWLMAAATAYVLFGMGLAFGPGAINVSVGGTLLYAPGYTWAIPFAAASVLYLFTSAAVVAAAHPWRWIGAVVFAYLVALGYSDYLGLLRVNQALRDVFVGRYGLCTVLTGTDIWHFERVFWSGLRPSDLVLWLRAVLLWVVIGGASVCLAAYRHKDV